MFSGLLNSIGLAQNATTGLGNSAQNLYNQGIITGNPAAQNQLSAQAQAYNQALMAASLNQQRHEWMINGRTMTWTEWLDELAPGEDNPMRTFLTLKYRGTK